jgi:molecular chaperone DnaJ
MAKKDYYEILGVDKSATQSEIKKAYRNLSKLHHPDRGGDEEIFKQISEAYDVLSDENKKARYDRFGHNDNIGNYDDMYSGFESMFGHMFRRQQQQQIRKGENMILTVNLTLEDIHKGTTKNYNYNRKVSCEDCNGSGGHDPIECHVCNGSGHIKNITKTQFGYMETISECNHCHGSGTIFKTPCKTCNGEGLVNKKETIEIKVPAGVVNGMAFIMSGKGHGIKNGVEGDLIVRVNELPHSIFNRVGNDLRMNLKLEYHQLILGDKVEIDTIDGNKIRITIPEYSNVGQNLRIPSKGLSEINSSSRGDLFVNLDINMPKSLNDDLKSIIIDLKELYEKKEH